MGLHTDKLTGRAALNATPVPCGQFHLACWVTMLRHEISMGQQEAGGFDLDGLSFIFRTPYPFLEATIKCALYCDQSKNGLLLCVWLFLFLRGFCVAHTPRVRQPPPIHVGAFRYRLFLHFKRQGMLCFYAVLLLNHFPKVISSHLKGGGGEFQNRWLFCIPRGVYSKATHTHALACHA